MAQVFLSEVIILIKKSYPNNKKDASNDVFVKEFKRQNGGDQFFN